jgi:olfactory receptor
MNTCVSHIITVGLFYGFEILVYVKPKSAESVGQGKFFSVFYTLVVPYAKSPHL